MNKPSFWNRISEIQAKQELKGIRSYGQRIEDNDTMTLEERLTMLEEELVDALMYCEWIKDCMSDWWRSDDNKYHWHDLRKNPLDLPEVNSFVLCEWVGGSNNWHDVFLFDNDPRPHFRNTHGDMISITGDEKFTYEGQVIAWREIEPFEEVE